MIKKNAGYPCPCCLIPKIDTIKMGMELDMRFRRAHPRIDDHPRQHTVQHARQLVFEQGILLASDRLARILKYSGVPTLVSPNALYISWLILRPLANTKTHLPRMPSHSSLGTLASITTNYLSSIYYMSLNSGYGRQYSHI